MADEVGLYQPLQCPQGTRLLKIQPGAPKSQLILDLVEASLLDNPKYDAISYTWGHAASTIPVRINDKVIYLRRNLHSFLLRLRDRNHTHFLWVDAISIRQDDNEEKSREVGMIGNIFCKAKRVLVWLGEHAYESESLFKPWPKPQYQPKSRDLSWEDQKKRFAVWSGFFSCRYWRRLWVVQELILAKSIEVSCGDSHATWEYLFQSRMTRKMLWKWASEGTVSSDAIWDGVIVNRFLTTYCGISHTQIKQFQSQAADLAMICLERCNRNPDSAELIFEAKQRPNYYKTSSHENLTKTFEDYGCSDSRDQIYALLALDRRFRGGLALTPDYTIHEAELYVRVCVDMIEIWASRGTSSWKDLLRIKSISAYDKFDIVGHLETRLLKDRSSGRKALEIILTRLDDSELSGERIEVYVYIVERLMVSQAYGTRAVVPQDWHDARYRHACRLWLLQYPGELTGYDIFDGVDIDVAAILEEAEIRKLEADETNLRLSQR
jgi:Heterokaryon incompatibility protein (HET)